MTINDTIHHPISINLTEGGMAILKNEHDYKSPISVFHSVYQEHIQEHTVSISLDLNSTIAQMLIDLELAIHGQGSYKSNDNRYKIREFGLRITTKSEFVCLFNFHDVTRWIEIGGPNANFTITSLNRKDEMRFPA